MSFDPMRGPPAIAIGVAGELRVGGIKAGRLTQWRVVNSPKVKHEDGTPYLALFGEGRFLRFFAGSVGARVSLTLVPSPQPYRIGRPKPKTPKPFTLTGKLLEYSAGRITISEGEITARG